MEHDVAASTSPLAEPEERVTRREGELFDMMATTADRTATTAEYSAAVHDAMSDDLAGSAKHAERDRRMATAERESTRALRQGRLPSDAVREIIRQP